MGLVKIEIGSFLRENKEHHRDKKSVAEVLDVNKDGEVILDIYKNTSAIGGLNVRLYEDVLDEFELICSAENRQDKV